MLYPAVYLIKALLGKKMYNVIFNLCKTITANNHTRPNRPMVFDEDAQHKRSSSRLLNVDAVTWLRSLGHEFGQVGPNGYLRHTAIPMGTLGDPAHCTSLHARDGFSIRRFRVVKNNKRYLHLVVAFDAEHRYLEASTASNTKQIKALIKDELSNNRNFLGRAECSKGKLELLEIPHYARRCGFGSVLATLCFIDDVTQERGGFLHWRSKNNQWQEMINGNDPDGAAEDIDLKCETMIYIDEGPVYPGAGNKAFIYAAMGSSFQDLIVYGGNGDLNCAKKGRIFQTNTLLTLINQLDPLDVISTLDDFSAKYGQHWYFCKPM